MKKISLELGSGGRLMRDFIAGQILPAFRNRRPRRARRRRPPSREASPSRPTATSSTRSSSPAATSDAGRQRHGQRPRRLRRRAALPLARPDPRGRARGSNVLDRVLRSIREPRPERPGSAIVTGDTKVVRQRPGRQDLYQHGRHRRGRRRPAPDGRIRRGDKVILTGTLGDHSLAVLARPGRFRLEDRRPAATAPPPLPPPALEEGALCGCGTSPGAAWRRSCPSWPTAPPSRSHRRSPDPLCRGPSGRRASSSGSTLSIWPARAKPSSSRPAAEPANSCAACAATLSGRKAAIIGEVQDKWAGPASCCSDAVSGGLRLLEPLTSELLPRIC